MNILLLGAGGGGGNILRSVKAMFERDVHIAQQSDPEFAERLRRAVTTRWLDTNEFSLADIAPDERVVIGPSTTGRLGSRHDPGVARAALEESKAEVERLLNGYSAVIIIATGGKGTGAGTIFPLAEMARRLRKVVLPVFVRPSFERHEVDKRRYDHALQVAAQFDSAKIRLLEILNDRGYQDGDPQPQSVVWERMNRPIACGLRGLLHVLWDLSQVDPSDLSILLAGHGRLRVGFGEIAPMPGVDPTDEQMDDAVRACWTNAYYTFSRPPGTTLVCIHGDWSNVADARIKGRLAASALQGAADSPYTPLYARAVQTPKPWGVTALFAEYTGPHSPLDIDWPRAVETALPQPAIAEPAPATAPPVAAHEPPRFARLWDFAVAINRGDPAALALASAGEDATLPLEGDELKKLLGTFWFRSAFPRLSPVWRGRLLDVIVDGVTMPNHVVYVGRQRLRASELSHEQLREIAGKTMLRGAVGADLQLLWAIASLWGDEALARLKFADIAGPPESSFITLLQGLRR